MFKLIVDNKTIEGNTINLDKNDIIIFKVSSTCSPKDKMKLRDEIEKIIPSKAIIISKDIEIDIIKYKDNSKIDDREVLMG